MKRTPYGSNATDRTLPEPPPAPARPCVIGAPPGVDLTREQAARPWSLGHADREAFLAWLLAGEPRSSVPGLDAASRPRCLETALEVPPRASGTPPG